MLAFFKFILVKIRSSLKTSDFDFRIFHMLIIASGITIALLFVLIGLTGKTFNGFCGIQFNQMSS